jgi:hypothetical protein
MKKSTLGSLALYVLVPRIPLSKRLLTSTLRRSRKASAAFLIYRIVRRLMRSQDRAEITVITKDAVVETY